mgnify:CR=1 FL=1
MGELVGSGACEGCMLTLDGQPVGRCDHDTPLRGKGEERQPAEQRIRRFGLDEGIDGERLGDFVRRAQEEDVLERHRAILLSPRAHLS